MYARVVVDTGSTSPLDSLTYEIPDGLPGEIGIGACVLVPLGSRQAVGYVIGFEDEPSVPNVRPIISELVSPVRLTEDMLGLARWISEQYACPLPRSVASMLPGVGRLRLQAQVGLCDRPPEANLTPTETRLMDIIRSSCKNNVHHNNNVHPEPVEGCGHPTSPRKCTVDSLCESMAQPTVQRALRQLEGKGYVQRTWQLLPPSGKPRIMRGVRLVAAPPPNGKLSAKQTATLELITQLGRDMSLVELTQRYAVSRSSIDSLESKGLLEPVDIVFRRAPAFHRVPESRVTLGDDQQTAVDAITNCIQAGVYGGHLLYGVTASGKTEVYLRCIERALAMGRTSLVLLPEIAITTQVMNIFKSRFGDQVAVMHSALSAGERCDEWVRVEEGEAQVVLGARSAVFAPLKNLGVVIVDEEHESSYKQDVAPRYHGREVAIRRAKESGAALVLGSATPSVESFHRAQQGEYKLLSMPNRVESRPMPTVHVVDMRQEWAAGTAVIFSKPLEDGIRERLARGQQVMLLQNRRAYLTFLLCRDCGFVPECPNCAVSLKFHNAEKKLSCHHCDFSKPAPTICPKCEGTKIRKFGIGTERVEEEVRTLFPDARILRMDRDTTSHKGAHGAILDRFRRGEADILVGTQMIAKGLDFPNVTLVGVISADTSLHLPDFRASERTFQLIAQVSGRSGRGTELGEVVIQTFDPENYAVECAVNHDYEKFCRTELEMRQETNYPPFASLVSIVARDPDDSIAKSRLTELVSLLKSARMADRMGIEIIGPNPAVITRLRGEYRWRLVLRSTDRGKMLDLVRGAFDRAPDLRRRLSVDVDPVSML